MAELAWPVLDFFKGWVWLLLGPARFEALGREFSLSLPVDDRAFARILDGTSGHFRKWFLSFSLFPHIGLITCSAAGFSVTTFLGTFIQLLTINF